MSDNPKHVTVRLRVPPELRDKIAESAEKYNRSMNADMVARLEESFENKQLENKFGDPEFRKRLERSFEMTAKIFEGLENGTIEIKYKEK